MAAEPDQSACAGARVLTKPVVAVEAPGLQFGDRDCFQRAGGDPEIFYLHGFWKLEPGQAWVIDTAVPACPYWNFQLDNWWMESMDYRFHKVTVNKHTARLNADDSVTFLFADSDPGWGNWIDTAGHTSGTALIRWVGATHHPLPTCRIVEL